MNERLAAALGYADNGDPVFPVGGPDGKTPLTEHGVLDATTDHEQLTRWWTRWPDANIAMAMGGARGLLAMDVDCKNGQPGYDSLAELTREYSPLPTTRRARTPSGGEHYLFTLAPQSKVRNRVGVRPGLDARAEGGYIVVAPSRIGGAGYEWVNPDAPIAPAPDWLVTVLSNGHRPAAPLPDTIGIGERNAWLASLAGSMRRRDAGVTAIAAALHAENRARCVPPLEDREVEAIARSVARYPAGETPPAAGGALRPHVLSVRALAALDLPPRDTIIDPWLPKGALMMIHGWRGIGKSLALLALARAITTKTPFFGWPVTRPWRVLLVDGELPTVVLQRRVALIFGESRHGLPGGLDILPSERLWLDDVPLNLADPAHQARVDAAVDALAAEDRWPDVIAFDNLSALSAGLDENSNSELDQFLRWLVMVRYRGHTVILIHHSGKSGDQRGASRREDLLDVVLKLSAPKDADDQPPASGARFLIELTKTRSVRPRIDRLVVELRPGVNGGPATWTHETTDRVPAFYRTLRALRDGPAASQTDLCERTGLSKGVVSGHVARGREKQFIEPGRLALTDAGRRAVAEPEF